GQDSRTAVPSFAGARFPARRREAPAARDTCHGTTARSGRAAGNAASGCRRTGGGPPGVPWYTTAPAFRIRGIATSEAAATHIQRGGRDARMSAADGSHPIVFSARGGRRGPATAIRETTADPVWHPRESQPAAPTPTEPVCGRADVFPRRTPAVESSACVSDTRDELPIRTRARCPDLRRRKPRDCERP